MEAGKREEDGNNGVQNESRGVGGCATEICTNLRLLVMSGDKLRRQKESGRRMGARMRWERGRARTTGERKRAVISIADIAFSAHTLPRRRIHYVACLGDFSQTPYIYPGSVPPPHPSPPPSTEVSRERTGIR